MHNKTQQGFTLIELVVVIVILGILAATALPKFIDLSSEAGTAAANGVAGSLSSGTALNYAARLAGRTAPQAPQIAGDNAATCTAATLGQFVSGVTLVDAAPTNSNEYQISAGSGSCVSNLTGTPPVNAAGTAVTCNIKGAKGEATTATIICTD